MISALTNLLFASIMYGAIIMFGALGEIIIEKVGHLNLGIPGIVYLGGLGGFLGGFLYENAVESPITALLIIIPLLSGMGFAMIGGLIYAFFTVTLRANQNVSGLALTYVSVGISAFLGQYVVNAGGYTYAIATWTSDAFTANLYSMLGMSSVGEVGADILRVLFGHGFLVYFSIVLAILCWIFLSKSRIGLNLRSIGESPATADAVGINVNRYKYLAILSASAIAGLGGIYYILGYSSGVWNTTNSMEAIGWLSVALVIFSTWKPLNAIWGSFVFAFFFWLYQSLNGLFGITLSTAQTSLVQMLPYLVTLGVLILVSLRKKKELQPPSALGIPYFREDR